MINIENTSLYLNPIISKTSNPLMAPLINSIATNQITHKRSILKSRLQLTKRTPINLTLIKSISKKLKMLLFTMHQPKNRKKYPNRSSMTLSSSRISQSLNQLKRLSHHTTKEVKRSRAHPCNRQTIKDSCTNLRLRGRKVITTTNHQTISTLSSSMLLLQRR